MLMARYGDSGDDALHIFDYAVVGFLIACMIWAGAMALHKARCLDHASSSNEGRSRRAYKK